MFRDPSNIRIDMWPDVSEYEKTYPTGLKLPNGEGARFFCSDDESTVETHFRCMEEYGLDGVFLQRFFGAATREPKDSSTTVLRHALKSAQRHLRTLCYDRLFFDDDGTIRPVVQTRRARQPFWKGK